ncbi:asparagine--tRNA ligase [Endozoicomonas sp. SM1973]|uniref:Asparagine--tRNA ligase n=1 Tax=Spartinivicinus marinus TaxID=2994442 RepID=A0A853HYS2_9GAMM|nr:asparagine--tRNA ligase [Spartinivicinus marinus]MCX4024632.1 asparagine--tRNA ligase [Spartinivicinus marinus]NYZ66343.1 asparagine--tRNA ligase [Spartinivicinus marinus]
MAITSIKEALAGAVSSGGEITIQGWIRTRRDSKAGISFLNVHDGSCFDPIQIVVPKELANYEETVLQITSGCAVTITGTLVQSQGKGQSFEIQATQVTVVGWVENPDSYPIQPKPHTVEFLREVAHLRPRTNLIGAVTRVRNTISQSIHQFFNENGYCWIHTPIITASDCEGAGELFRVSALDMQNLPRTEQGNIDFSQDFFGCESFLTVSGQLNVEAYCLAMSKVYTFGPTFRAENSNTSRHLAEFWMVEPEIAFADLKDVIQLAENMLKYVFNKVLSERADDMDFFAKRVEKTAISRLQHILESQFVEIDYTDAIKILQDSGKKFEHPVSWGIDLQTEHERFLSEEHVKAPVVVSNYPKDIKAFYMRMNDDNKTVAAMDVLAPGIGEIIGGSQREERLDKLDLRLDEMGIPKESLGWYRDLRRYGTVPHGGFGLGLERLVSYITGVANVRDVIPFPRTRRNAGF